MARTDDKMYRLQVVADYDAAGIRRLVESVVESWDELLDQYAEKAILYAKANVAPGQGPGPHPHRGSQVRKGMNKWLDKHGKSDPGVENYNWTWEDTGELQNSLRYELYWEGYRRGVRIYTESSYGINLEFGWHPVIGSARIRSPYFYRYPWLAKAMFKAQEEVASLLTRLNGIEPLAARTAVRLSDAGESTPGRDSRGRFKGYHFKTAIDADSPPSEWEIPYPLASIKANQDLYEFEGTLADLAPEGSVTVWGEDVAGRGGTPFAFMSEERYQAAAKAQKRVYPIRKPRKGRLLTFIGTLRTAPRDPFQAMRTIKAPGIITASAKRLGIAQPTLARPGSMRPGSLKKFSAAEQALQDMISETITPIKPTKPRKPRK